MFTSWGRTSKDSRRSPDHNGHKYEPDPYANRHEMVPHAVQPEGNHVISSPSYRGPPSYHVQAPYHHASTEADPPIASGRIDWKETPTEHVFKIEFPGMKKDEVKVDLQDNKVLMITGERCIEREDRSDPWHRIERTCARIIRSIRLPDDAKSHHISACMENGVLTIRVPREEMKMSSHAISTRIPVY